MKMDHSNLKNFPAGFVLELWWMARVNKMAMVNKTRFQDNTYSQRCLFIIRTLYTFEHIEQKLGIILLIASSFIADGSWTWWKSGQAAKQKHPFPWKEAKRYPINLIWITPRYSQSFIHSAFNIWRHMAYQLKKRKSKQLEKLRIK